MTKFNSRQTDQIIDYLKTKWQGRPCPMCNASSWIVQDSCYQLMSYSEGKFVIGGTVIPIIPVTCNNCSNTVLVNAILSGIIKQTDVVKAETKPAEQIDKSGDSV